MDSAIVQRALFVLVSLAVASCAWLTGPEPTTPYPCRAAGWCTRTAPIFEIVARDDPLWPVAAAASAVQPSGMGGISMAIAVRLQHDTPVYRVWTDGTDRPSSRIGPWWTFDPPAGTDKDFRERYAVCEAWNPRLSRLAACTLSRGSVVLIGPGQSVDETTCKKTGEQYPANPHHYQVYIARTNEPGVLTCPHSDADARLDPKDMGAATRPCTLQDRCQLAGAGAPAGSR
jgi:hypothetical protein